MNRGKRTIISLRRDTADTSKDFLHHDAAVQYLANCLFADLETHGLFESLRDRCYELHRAYTTATSGHLVVLHDGYRAICMDSEVEPLRLLLTISPLDTSESIAEDAAITRLCARERPVLPQGSRVSTVGQTVTNTSTRHTADWDDLSYDDDDSDPGDGKPRCCNGECRMVLGGDRRGEKQCGECGARMCRDCALHNHWPEEDPDLCGGCWTAATRGR